MVSRSMHECMPLDFVQVFSSVSQNSSQGFYAMKMILSPFYCALTKTVQSPVRLVKSGKAIKGIPVAHEGWPWLGLHFALHNNACSITIGVVSIRSSSQRCQGLLLSVLSLQVSVAIPYYSIVMVSIGIGSASQHRVSGADPGFQIQWG